MNTTILTAVAATIAVVLVAVCYFGAMQLLHRRLDRAEQQVRTPRYTAAEVAALVRSGGIGPATPVALPRIPLREATCPLKPVVVAGGARAAG